MFFSIIIPTLNEEKFLPRLLNCLKKQKAKNFEIIISDANSEDKTIEVAKKFKTHFKHFSIISSQKRNVATQRNLGAKKAKGDFLIFLDADSQVTPSFTKKLEKTIKKTPGLIYLPKFIPDIKTPDIVLFFELSFFFIELSQYTPKPFSTGGEIIIEKNLFHFIGGFNENAVVSEDHELLQRAKKYGVTAKTLPNVTVKFSLRRMQKEGRLKFFLKYLYFASQTLIKKRIDKTLLEYEMGGHLYKTSKKRKNNLTHILQQKLKKFKSLTSKLLKSLS